MTRKLSRLALWTALATWTALDAGGAVGQTYTITANFIPGANKPSGDCNNGAVKETAHP
ncbi:MAG TPA: hypothetical protein VK446_10425 [Methylocystis sp.]|nr:hypothetical protein [Methylocystis sp.]